VSCYVTPPLRRPSELSIITMMPIAAATIMPMLPISSPLHMLLKTLVAVLLAVPVRFMAVMVVSKLAVIRTATIRTTPSVTKPITSLILNCCTARSFWRVKLINFLISFKYGYIVGYTLRDADVEQLNFVRSKEDSNAARHVNVKVKVENNVWYLRLPKFLRDLKVIPEVLNWELVVEPHPSGNPFLAEIKLKPTFRASENSSR